MLQCRNETQSCFSNLVYCIDHFVLFGPCFFAHCPTEYHREAGRLYAAMRIMAGHSDALTGFWQSVIAFLLQLFWAEFLAKAICFPSIFIPCFFNGKPPPTNKQTNLGTPLCGKPDVTLQGHPCSAQSDTLNGILLHWNNPPQPFSHFFPHGISHFRLPSIVA